MAGDFPAAVRVTSGNPGMWPVRGPFEHKIGPDRKDSPVGVGIEEPRWLSEGEQESWRAYLRGSRYLEEALDRDLQVHGLQLTEYEILSMLSESDGGRLLAWKSAAGSSASPASRTAGESSSFSPTWAGSGSPRWPRRTSKACGAISSTS
jgi:hypothetical protein